MPGQDPGLRNPTTILTTYLRLSQRAKCLIRRSGMLSCLVPLSDGVCSSSTQCPDRPVLNNATAAAPIAKRLVTRLCITNDTLSRYSAHPQHGCLPSRRQPLWHPFGTYRAVSRIKLLKITWIAAGLDCWVCCTKQAMAHCCTSDTLQH